MNNSNEYPRVLVVSSSVFNKYAGTGVTLSNLFRNWPKDRLSMIHSDVMFNPDEEICDNYYYHGYDDRYIIGLQNLIKYLKWIGKKFPFYHRPKPLKSDQLHSNSSSPKDRVLNNPLFKSLKFVFGDLEPFTRIGISKELEKWLGEFDPDIIYSPISTISNMAFVLKISHLTSSKIALHFMDDWPSVKYKDGLMAPILQVKMQSILKKILKQANIRICIGQSMCDEYKSRYGYTFTPFSSPAEPKLWKKYNSKTKRKTTEFKIVYIGTFNSKNIETITKISHAVNELFRGGRNVRMEIYSFQPRVEIYRHQFEHEGSVTVNEVPATLNEFRALLSSGNVVVIPLDYTKESIERMRLSFFTKIPAYMLSGSPILLCGPEDIGVVKQAKGEGWAYVISEDSIDAIKMGIIELMDDPSMREIIVAKSIEIATSKHDAIIVRESFRRELAAAI